MSPSRKQELTALHLDWAFEMHASVSCALGTLASFTFEGPYSAKLREAPIITAILWRFYERIEIEIPKSRGGNSTCPIGSRQGSGMNQMSRQNSQLNQMSRQNSMIGTTPNVPSVPEQGDALVEVSCECCCNIILPSCTCHCCAAV